MSTTPSPLATSLGMSPLTSSITSSILGGAGAGLFQQPTNTNGTTSSTGSSNSTGSSSTQRTLTPYQSSLQQPLSQYIMQLMQNPQAAVAPFANQARNNINDNYSGLADSLRQQFLGNGGGASGKYGTALAGANVQRLGQLSNSDSGFAQTAAQLPLQGAGLAEQFLGQNFGQTTNGTQTGSTSSNGTSSQTSSTGNPLLTGLGSILSLFAGGL